MRAGAHRLREAKEFADFILDESVRVAELGFHPTQEISFKLKRTHFQFQRESQISGVMFGSTPSNAFP